MGESVMLVETDEFDVRKFEHAIAGIDDPLEADAVVVPERG